MAKTTKIRHVQGNVLKLAIPLTLRIVNLVDGEVTYTDEDFVPTGDVTIIFGQTSREFEFVATMRDGNVAVVEDKGTLPVGTYAITALCKAANGDPMRFKQRSVVQVVDATIDAGIDVGVEFEDTEWYLDAAIFLAVKGEDGVGIADITINETDVSGEYNYVVFTLTNGESYTLHVRNGESTEQLLPSDIVRDANYVHTDNNYTNNEKAQVGMIGNMLFNVEYDVVSNRINFFAPNNPNTPIKWIDATRFTRDGMVKSIQIVNGYLRVTFNTDANKDPINVPLSDYFYTKSQVNTLLQDYVGGEQYSEDIAIINEALQQLVNFTEKGEDGRLNQNLSTAVVLNGFDGDTYSSSYGYFYDQTTRTITWTYSQGQASHWKNIGEPDDRLIYYNISRGKFYRYDTTNGMVEISTGGSGGGGGTFEQVQADWNQTNTSAVDFIKNKPTIPYDLSDLNDDATHRLVTDEEKEAWDAKLDPSDVPANTSDLINDSNFVASTDLADVATSGSYNDLTNKPTIPAAQVAADWNQASSSAVDYIKNKPTIPTKVSDLTNDSAFVTANDVSGIVAASGDLVLVESPDYVDLFIYGAEVTVSPSSLALYAAQKSSTITVAGSHLKADIAITVPTGFTASPSTIAHANGTVSSTSVTITYTGADASTASGSITATAGEATASIPVAYTQYSGPTIVPSANTLSVKAGAGSSNTGTITVNGFNLEGNITASISGTDASKFSVSPASLSPTSGTVSGGSLTVTYSPAAADSGTHSATLTLSSTNATSVTISLGGAVSTITTSESALTMTCQKNSSTTATFDVEGENLSGDLSISASGTGLSVDTNSITATDGEVSSTTITVTFSPTAAGTVNGSITISDGNITKTITVIATATGIQVVYNSLDTNGVSIEWELGQLSTTTGGETESTTRWRTADFLPCSTSFYYKRQGGGNCGICFYASDYSFVAAEYIGSAGSKEVTIPTGAVYFRIYCNNKDQYYVCALDSSTGKYMTISNSAGGTVTTYA